MLGSEHCSQISLHQCIRRQTIETMKICPGELFSDLPANEMLHCLSSSLQNYYKTGELCDITIRCTSDDVKLSAHKLMLVAMSPYFHNALIGPLSTNSDVELPFTSTTVKFLLDCLYQYQGEMVEKIDVMEFIHLATYLDVRPLVKHGLRVAAMQLRSDSCLDTLIDISQPGSSPVPHQWKEIVLRYAVDHLEYEYLNHEEGRILLDTYIKRFSPDLVRLFCSTILENHRPPVRLEFIPNLVLSFIEYHSQPREANEEHCLYCLNNFSKSFTNLVLQTKDAISMMSFVRNKGISSAETNPVVVIRPKANNEVLVQLRTVTSYDYVGNTTGDIKAWRVDYACDPKKTKLIGEEDIARFSKSLSEILHKSSSYIGKHREDERKCFMWGGILYSVHFYLETRESQLMMYVIWERYDWVRGCWLQAFRTEPLEVYEDHVITGNYGLEFPGDIVSCISWEMFSFTLCYNKLTMHTRLMIGHEFAYFSTYHFDQEVDTDCMQLIVATDKYMINVRLLLFFTPLNVHTLLIAKEMDEENDTEEIELGHPEENFGTQPMIGKIVSSDNNVYHLYSKKYHDVPNEGIHVDCLDLRKNTWIKLEDLCKERKFVDSYVLNDEIYLMYTKPESDSVQFIAKCRVKDDLNMELVKSSERKLKDTKDDHDEKVQRLVVPKSAMPLDFI